MRLPTVARQVLRIVLLPAVMLAGFILYGQSIGLADVLMPVPEDRRLALPILISQGFLAATLSAAVACFPLAWLYGRAAPGVAVLITLPVLYIAGPDLLRQDLRLETMFIHALELASFVILLVGATWLARRYLTERRRDSHG
ncbi:hypothetical protein [Zoogloea dura]|uniref:Transmembrane protein n=1 Tax=Zoogloea dura TaxID=2728840 RepID=A0A848G2C6_9RHOO|nr:hypothetical protein [Zoogloea dura]NML25309.1 hypothetical protein [Zoogloea dura]